jgi:hypothetical protein
MNRTSHITGHPQANENGTLNERYQKAEEYLNPNLSGIKKIIDVDQLYIDTPELYNEDNNYGGGYDTPSSSKTKSKKPIYTRVQTMKDKRPLLPLKNLFGAVEDLQRCLNGKSQCKITARTTWVQGTAGTTHLQACTGM